MSRAFPRHSTKSPMEEFVITGGGCPPNAAIAIARLEAEARVVRPIGDDEHACRWRCLSRWACARARRGQGACGRNALCRRCGRAQVHALRRHRRNADASRGRGAAGRARSLLRRPQPAETGITAMVGSRFDFGFTIVRDTAPFNSLSASLVHSNSNSPARADSGAVEKALVTTRPG